jgi:hypothetical protein
MELKGIALFLFVGGSILFAGLAIVVSALVLLQLSRFERVRWRLANSRAAFVKTLLRGIAGETIHDIGDVYNAYRAFFGIGALRASHLEEIAEFLRAAMLRGASSPPKPSDVQLHQTAHMLGNLLAANQRPLEVELQCVPFSGTTELERQLLEEISELATADRAVAGTKLAALAKAIRIRQDTVERLDRERGRSLKLARWGWLGMVGFSVLTIVLGVVALGGY